MLSKKPALYCYIDNVIGKTSGYIDNIATIRDHLLSTIDGDIECSFGKSLSELIGE